MFNFLKKKTQGVAITFKITGMHCTGCAMNIDGALEDTDGVLSATTSYAKNEVVIQYLPEKITPANLTKIIQDTGYSVTE
jgi:copper chaperone CopZ